mgnify:CR=1 FL=1
MTSPRSAFFDRPSAESVASGRLWILARDGQTRVLLYRNRLYSDGTNTYVLGHGLDDTDPLGVDTFATHRLPLEQAPHAYEIFQKKQDGAIKIVLKP